MATEPEPCTGYQRSAQEVASRISVLMGRFLSLQRGISYSSGAQAWSVWTADGRLKLSWGGADLLAQYYLLTDKQTEVREETASPTISPCLWTPSSDPYGSGAWPFLDLSLRCRKKIPWPRARRQKGPSCLGSSLCSSRAGIALSGEVSSTLCPCCLSQLLVPDTQAPGGPAEQHLGSLHQS